MQQPVVWHKEYELLLKDRERIETFVSRYLDLGYEIIFSGAGTSAFIGDVLQVALCGTRFRRGVSIPTTDLITNPHTYISSEKKVLMVSFARSGDSPESLAAIDIANGICKEIAHIYITCNAEGRLAKNADRDNVLLLLLPPETNDRGLAMTSSFSTMLFACMTVANIREIEAVRPFVESLVKLSAETLGNIDHLVARLANLSFDRAIFLGSGALKGGAKESHLKLQELTDGKVVCNFDSFLGFRHGPKAVVNERTMLVYLFSGDSDTRRYEIDLVRQINSNNSVVAQIAVSEGKIEITGVKFDLEVNLGVNDGLQGIYKSIPYVLPAQLLGFYKSLDMGLNPDYPSVSGNIARVVEGVMIY
jgi:tagatose-6-phosphate ketose/aldose isomerase